MSSHNKCFYGEIKKNINTYWLSDFFFVAMEYPDKYSCFFFHKTGMLLCT